MRAPDRHIDCERNSTSTTLTACIVIGKNGVTGFAASRRLH